MMTAPERGGMQRKSTKKAPQREPGGRDKLPNLQARCSAFAHQLPDGDFVKPRYRPEIILPARLRRQQITRLLQARNGGPCVTDDAEVWFDEIAIHLLIACSARALDMAVEEWTTRHTPNLSKSYVAETIAQLKREPPFYTSIDIGRRLNVTADEKDALGLSHIAASDITPEEAAERKLKRRRERMKQIRLAKGETKRPQALSHSRTKPWLQAGFNTRRTWERHGMPEGVIGP